MKKILLAALLLVFSGKAYGRDIARLVEETLDAVADYHISGVTSGRLTLNMLEGLNAIDEGIHIKTAGNKIVLVRNGLILGRYDRPGTNRQWAALAEGMVNKIARNSPKISSIKEDRLFEIMASAMLSSLDEYSYYDRASMNKGQEAKSAVAQVMFTSGHYETKGYDDSFSKDGYLTLVVEIFKEGTAAHIEKAIRRFSSAFGPNFKGIIIDLRNNQGGVLKEAVSSAGLFLSDRSKIASIRGKNSSSMQEYRARKASLIQGIPIAIIINSGTASSAELFAAALRENRKAVILGEKSYGKASVQTRVKLGNGDELVLTWARFLTAKGKDIEGAGLMPDKKVAKDPYIVARAMLSKVNAMP